MKFTLAIFVSLCILFSHPIQASTVNALSNSYTDVSNAVASAGFGGTVWVPPIPSNTNTWKAGLSLSGVSLLASNTIGILFSTNSDIGLYLNSGGTFSTISNFVFDVNQNSGPTKALMSIDGSNVCFRITQCTFLHSSTGVGSGTHFGIFIAGPNSLNTSGPFGVVDHCNFYFPSIGVPYNFLCCYGNGSFGNLTNGYSWTNVMSWGTTNVVDIETCNFGMPSCKPDSALCDAFGGARLCIRYCNITNIIIQTHGKQAAGFGGQLAGGLLHEEVYNNNIAFNDSANTLSYVFWLRGGTCAVFSNSFVNYAFSFNIGEAVYFSVECAANTLWQSESCDLHLTYPTNYPGAEQVGQGVVNFTQGYQPAYFWSNVYPNVARVIFQIGTDGGDVPFLQQGRDFYTNSVMPNYTPLVYPSPLVGNPPPTYTTVTPSFILGGVKY